jgi:hypothetical protein
MREKMDVLMDGKQLVQEQWSRHALRVVRAVDLHLQVSCHNATVRIILQIETTSFDYLVIAVV